MSDVTANPSHRPKLTRKATAQALDLFRDGHVRRTQASFNVSNPDAQLFFPVSAQAIVDVGRRNAEVAEERAGHVPAVMAAVRTTSNSAE
jgi:hypothetical protein